jgi:hypothetical protein
MNLCQFMLLVSLCFSLAGCHERLVEPADVFGDIKQGETYSSASTMVDDWYAVEAIDPQTFAINEPRSRPDHPHPLINTFLLAAAR